MREALEKAVNFPLFKIWSFRFLKFWAPSYHNLFSIHFAAHLYFPQRSGNFERGLRLNYYVDMLAILAWINMEAFYLPLCTTIFLTSNLSMLSLITPYFFLIIDIFSSHHKKAACFIVVMPVGVIFFLPKVSKEGFYITNS